MRYLLDTNVLVAALRSKHGASNAIVRRALLGDLPLVVHQKEKGSEEKGSGSIYLRFIYRVVMDILHMVGKIAFIPKPALPN